MKQDNTRRRPKESKHQNGFAIVAAVWLAGLTMVVAVEFASRVRLNTLLTNQYSTDVRLSAAAAGMMRLSALSTAASPMKEASGQESHCLWDPNTIVSIAVQDHAGLVDLNVASANLYRTLFVLMGVSETVAGKLANEIIDFRDADEITARGQPEPISRDGSSIPNRPFETVEELDLLPSMTDSVYIKVRDFFTVYSGQPGVDLASLPMGLSAYASMTSSQDLLQSFAVSSPHRSFRLRVTVQQPDKASYQITSNIIVLHQPTKPFAFLTWNEGIADQREDVRGSSLSNCFN